MAGFFDSLLGLENEPESRDYKTWQELSSPEEQEAYRAGASATGSLIPGLDYARSMARGVGREISQPSMGPIGEQYNQTMDEYRRRQEAAQQLQQQYPQAYRSGQLRGTENIPGAELGLMMQPGIAGAAAGMMGRGAAGAARGPGFMGGGPRGGAPNIIEGEFTEAAPTPQLNYRRSVNEAATPDTGGWDSVDVRRPGRTERWREPFFPEPRLNAEEPVAPATAAETVVPTFARREAAPAYSAEPVEAPAGKSFSPNQTMAQKVLKQLEGEPLTGFEKNMVRSHYRAHPEYYTPEEIVYGGEGVNKNVYNALMRQRAGGAQLTPFEQNMVNNYMASFQPKPTLGIHGSSAEGVEQAIEARRAAEAAKAERIANMPEGMRKNMEVAKESAARRNAAELAQWRAENPRGMRVRPEFQAYSESELPVVYKPNQVLPPIVEQAGKKALFNKAIGLAGGIGGGIGGTGYHLAHNQGAGPAVSLPVTAEKEKQLAPLPDWKPNIPNSNMATPSMASLYGPESLVARTDKNAPASTSPSRAVPGHAAPRHAAPRHAAPARRAATSNQRYWGDWRDVEPYASDPIGNFIDELTGDVRSARKRGTISSPMSPYRGQRGGQSLGDLLPFKDGGAVRQGYADGSSVEEERIPIVSDIGDALGGLFRGGDKDVVASDRSSGPSGGVGDFFERWSTNPLSQFLFATGIGAMASDRVNPLQAIGEGGLRGLEYMQAAQAAQRVSREQERARREREEFLKSINGPDAGEEGEPTKTSEVETPTKTKVAAGPSVPEVPQVAPTAGAEGAPKEATPVSVAATAPAVSAAPVDASIVASDDRVRNLTSLHNKLSKAILGAPDAETRAVVAARIKAIEFEINKIAQAKKDAAAAAERAIGRDIQRKYLETAQGREQREAAQARPEYVEQKQAAEQAAKDAPKLQAETRSGALVAENTLQQINQVEKAYKSGSIHTSPMVYNWLKSAQGFVSEFSPEIAGSGILGSKKAMANTDALVALGVSDLMQKLGGSLGPGISNEDRNMINKQAIGIEQSPQANIRMMANLKKVARRQIEVNKFMEDYIVEHGRLDADYQNALTRHFANKPLGLDSSIPLKKGIPEGSSEKEIREEVARRKKQNG